MKCVGNGNKYLISLAQIANFCKTYNFHFTLTHDYFCRHGMSRMEYYVLNDMELSFKDILKRCLEGKPLTNQKELEEWEAKREERKETTKASTNGDSKNGDTEEAKEDTEMEEDKKEKKDEESEDKADEKEKEKEPENHENGEVEEPMETDAAETEKPAVKDKAVNKAVDKEKLMIEKAKALEKAAIPAPQLNLAQMEAAMAKGGGLGYDTEMINDLMVQTYAASVRWPRDVVLQERLKHIVTCVETDSWPVPANYCIGEHVSLSDPATPDQTARDTSTPLSEVTLINIILEI